MYIAVHYIGRKYTPGDILSDDTPPEKIRQWLEAGAIREAAPQPAPAPAEHHAKEKPGRKAQEPVEEKKPPETVSDELDEDAVAPEIDLMDGVVQPVKPARRTSTKTAERRKTK